MEIKTKVKIKQQVYFDIFLKLQQQLIYFNIDIDADDGGNGLSGGGIAGIVVGGLVAIVISLLAAVFIIKYRRQTIQNNSQIKETLKDNEESSSMPDTTVRGVVNPLSSLSTEYDV